MGRAGHCQDFERYAAQDLTARTSVAPDRGLSPDHARVDFAWSHAKIRVAGLMLSASAVPAVLGFAACGPVGRWVWLAWLAAIALLMHMLSRRTKTDTIVLSITERGILDRRLMPRRIAWQEIEAICPVDIQHALVVDIRLRWPETTLADARRPVRIGAVFQVDFNVPAVTISMALLDGQASDVLDAVARHRPDLLAATNRGHARVPHGGLAR
jgi:hypothetical protein